MRLILCLLAFFLLVESASAQGRIVARRGSTIQINNGVGGGGQSFAAAASFRSPGVAFRSPGHGAAFIGRAATFDVGHGYGLNRAFFPSYPVASFFPRAAFFPSYAVNRAFFPSYYPSYAAPSYVQADPGCVQGGGGVTYAPGPEASETTTTTTTVTTITRTLTR